MNLDLYHPVRRTKEDEKNLLSLMANIISTRHNFPPHYARGPVSAQFSVPQPGLTHHRRVS